MAPTGWQAILSLDAWSLRSLLQSTSKTIQEFSEQYRIPAWDDTQVVNSDEELLLVIIGRTSSPDVGLCRDCQGNKRLQRARRRIKLLQQEIEDHYSIYQISSDFLELREFSMRHGSPWFDAPFKARK